MIFPLLLIAGGAALAAFAFSSRDDEPPVHEPEYPPSPGKTGYPRVDAILGDLKEASKSSGIPLGLLVGWIGRESGGRLGETTKLDERGYFQLMPAESQALGLDHKRLSTDSVYSINAGLLIIGKYMKEIDALGVATKGSPFYWELVKLAHTMGTGATKRIVTDAKSEGTAGSWADLKQFAMTNNAKYLSAIKHSPNKWFPLVDAVYNVGKPFGFGSDGTTVVGALAYNDIPDVLDILKPRV